MKYDRFGKPKVGQFGHPCPRDPSLLAASSKRAPPQVGDVVSEDGHCPSIRRHRVIVEVAVDHKPQPLSLIRNWLVHAPPQLLFYHLELRSHAVSPGFPFDLELARASFPADEGEAQEVEGLRFAEPARRSAANRPNSINRVFSGCSDSANFPSRSRISSRKR
jgi:hypothetical protein